MIKNQSYSYGVKNTMAVLEGALIVFVLVGIPLIFVIRKILKNPILQSKNLTKKGEL
jgi:hypothetical protein